MIRLEKAIFLLLAISSAARANSVGSSVQGIRWSDSTEVSQVRRLTDIPDRSWEPKRVYKQLQNLRVKGWLRNTYYTEAERIEKWGRYAAGPFEVKLADGREYLAILSEKPLSGRVEGECYVTMRSRESFDERYGDASGTSSLLPPVTVKAIPCESVRKMNAVFQPRISDFHAVTQKGKDTILAIAGRTWRVEKEFEFKTVFPRWDGSYGESEEIHSEKLRKSQVFSLAVSDQLDTLVFESSYTDSLGRASISGGGPHELKNVVIRERELADGNIELLVIADPTFLLDARERHDRMYFNLLEEQVITARVLSDFMATRPDGACLANQPDLCNEALALYGYRVEVSAPMITLRLDRTSASALYLTAYDAGEDGVVAPTGEYLVSNWR